MSGAEPDAIRMAIIAGTASRHVRWRPLTLAEEAAAVAELVQVSGGRADLLAQMAGLALGFHAGTLEEPRQRQAAALLAKAGADPKLIPAWVQEGQRRATAAARLPYSGLARQSGRCCQMAAGFSGRPILTSTPGE